MANMDYCRFQNTVRDMDDCIENIYIKEDMSEEELEARKEFIEKCVEVALDWGDEIDKAVIQDY